MACLDVVVSKRDGVIAHVIHETGEKMDRARVYVVVVVCRIVSLEAVAGIDQQHVFRSVSLPDTVHLGIDSHYGFSDIPVSVGRIEPCSMDIVRSHQAECVDSIFRAAATCDGCEHGEKCRRFSQ